MSVHIANGVLGFSIMSRTFLSFFCSVLVIFKCTAAQCVHDNVFEHIVQTQYSAFCSAHLASEMVVTPTALAGYPCSQISSAVRLPVLLLSSFGGVLRFALWADRIVQCSCRTSPSSSNSALATLSVAPTNRPSNGSSATLSSRVPSHAPSPILTTTCVSESPTLTGIKFTATANQTTCYSLPTPTGQLLRSPLNITGQTSPYLVAAYSNYTSFMYLEARTSDNKSYILDLSNPSHFALVDEKGNAFYIDDAGGHFIGSNCSLILDFLVANFTRLVPHTTG